MSVAAETGGTGAQTLGQMRTLASDAQDLAAGARSTLQQIEALLKEQVQERPYRTLLIAAGAGYVLGGGLASSLTRQAIRLALRTIGPSMLAAALSPDGVAAVNASGAQTKEDTSRKRKEKRDDAE
jgi:hypothetical protein